MRDEQLLAFVSRAKAEAAADARRRVRWLRQQLDEDRTFASVCAGTVGSTVAVDLEHARSVRGRVVRADAGLLTIWTGDVITAIDVSAIAAVRPQPDDRDVGDALPHPTAHDTLADVLGAAAERRATVVLGTRGGHRFTGRVRGLGRDVVSLDQPTCAVQVSAVTDVTVGR